LRVAANFLAAARAARRAFVGARGVMGLQATNCRLLTGPLEPPPERTLAAERSLRGLSLRTLRA
jgi:hypothetical protein